MDHKAVMPMITFGLVDHVEHHLRNHFTIGVLEQHGSKR